MTHSLYWFRSDLRVADNAALADAIKESDTLIAVFILTPGTWKIHSDAACKIDFVMKNIRALSVLLWKQGIPLLIREATHFSDCPAVLSDLCKEHNIGSIYFNREYPIDEVKRDKMVQEQLGDRITVHAYDQQLVLAPGSVLNKQQEPYKVFTPFKKAWIARVQNTQAWHSCKGASKTFSSQVQPDSVPDEVAGFAAQESDQWQAGEAAAHKRLQYFCENSLESYTENRNIPGISGTSQLSPYLAQGVISVRQCISAALDSYSVPDIDCISAYDGLSTWVSELIWREFYQNIVYFFPDVSRNLPFRAQTDRIPWSNDMHLLNAWKNGKTGFPIVDAGMRQLQKTGWMHNRLRMITAMFLSKILLLDWRLGEKHFMEHLIDGEFSANNGGWQWCASTGTDAAPYFRIFNPTTQSKRFDPSGDFIRHFCPELEGLSDKSIHDPVSCGINVDDLGYPEPVVDYKASRLRTIELFKAL